jgi:hypothetical protein
MEPLGIYNELKSVPSEFLKEIGAGRLKGMSDIKPQWRIMKLTELFGPCGIGWKVQNVQFEYKQVSNNEIVVNCRLEFLYKWNDVWSEPIPATGGSKLATNESKGLYVSDEAEKMAYTDALSVAGKMIGLASDIYMGYGGKYDGVNTNTPPAKQNSSQGQNSSDDKPWLNVNSEQFAKVLEQVGKYSPDDLVRLARKKYKVSKDTEKAIRDSYRDNYEEVIIVD